MMHHLMHSTMYPVGIFISTFSVSLILCILLAEWKSITFTYFVIFCIIASGWIIIYCFHFFLVHEMGTFSWAVVNYINDSLDRKAKAQRAKAADYLLRCVFHKQIGQSYRGWGKQANKKHLDQIHNSHLNGYQKGQQLDANLEPLFNWGAVITLIFIIMFSIITWFTLEDMSNFDYVQAISIYSLLILDWILIIMFLYVQICMHKIVKLQKYPLPTTIYRRQCEWNDVFASVEDMMIDIEDIHHIMFGQLSENEMQECILHCGVEVVPLIVSVIMEYSWLPLPTTESIDNFRRNRFWNDRQDDHRPLPTAESFDECIMNSIWNELNDDPVSTIVHSC